ncbi:type I secretion protein [Roseovarius faecimaris]|uniref:Type I secretion protein n=1 Tax=Roseovarius faecimaris TaxID=2494550 RepID=A0A6I6IZT5_9RHOB|nr:Hint domain-containing protein [Roseovarius faecimaris]QGX98128.1 type I secretion protein [Roseovarius faecimaris]
MLDWSLFGSTGVDITSGQTVDTGGVAVTVDFLAQDEGAAARNLEFDQYVAPGENFDSTEGLKLFGSGGEGGVDDTSTTTLTFASTDAAFGDAVENVSFRINDLDLGQGGLDYTDIVTIRAYDAEGNLVDVTLTPGGDILTSGDTATGNDSASTFTPPTDPDTSLLVEIAGPVTRIEIDYDNGGVDQQAVWVTDIEFSTTEFNGGPDGYVDGNDDPNLIDDMYDGDPNGDFVDNNDALLPGEVGNDDIIRAGGGDDTVEAGDGDDEVLAGDGNDSVNGGVGDDNLMGEMGNDTLIGGDGSDFVAGGDGNDLIDTSKDGTTPVLPEEGFDDPTGVPVDPLPDDDRDYVEAGTGDDTITTGDDADTIFAGFGNDVIDGGIDDDVIRASVGDDSVIGGEGDDDILGGTGDDTIMGDGGIYGDELANDGTDPEPTNNEDTISGGSGNDVIYGQDDNDVLNGGIGDDTIDGGVDDDDIRGNDGNDVLIGGDGNDTIRGGNGDDTISGGDGIDLLEGRADRDVFEDVGAGDTVDGGTGGDDFDTLDLTGLGSFEIVGETVDPDGDSTSGTVNFLDADGNVTGSLVFTEIENLIPCFTPGTVIATPRGERRVEDLQVGDRIITRDNGLQEIRWIGQRDLTGQELIRSPHLKPVLIRAGSLGHGLPERDLLVSPQHRMLINSERAALYFEEREVLAAAKHLTGLTGVDTVETPAISYIHFMFDQHEVVLSNGSWTESFQPGEQVLDGMGDEQRDEIFDLFPELREKDGLEGYQAARRSLKKHETKLLVE